MNCMNCGSKHDVIDFYRGNEKLILCVDCRVKLANGELGKVGRPAIGITKKISLTLPKESWNQLDKKAEGNRSKFLRETITDYLETDKVSEPKGEYIVNGQDHILLNDLKEQAINLKNAIKRNSKKIDNPVLVTSTISNLEFFIENLIDDYE